MGDLVIVGCGGFGREVFDVVRAINAETPTWNLLGFVDDNPSDLDRKRVAALGQRILGPSPVVLKEIPASEFVVGIGNGNIRKTLSAQFENAGWTPATLIHPSAGVGSCTKVGLGSVLCQNSNVTTNVDIGRFVHIDRGSQVGHDVVLEDFVTINPLVAVSGNCLVEEAANLGSGATLLPGVKVGRGAVVGAAACVVRAVLAHSVVKGVPAR